MPSSARPWDFLGKAGQLAEQDQQERDQLGLAAALEKARLLEGGEQESALRGELCPERGGVEEHEEVGVLEREQDLKDDLSMPASSKSSVGGHQSVNGLLEFLPGGQRERGDALRQ